MNDPNLEMLKIAVQRLGPLASELVFVGGCTKEHYITDKAAADVRPTDDVDTIVEATTYAQYQKFAERLRAQGFAIDTREGAPVMSVDKRRNGARRYAARRSHTGIYEHLVSRGTREFCGIRLVGRHQYPISDARLLMRDKVRSI